jgi:hypothetical protein
MTIAAIVDVDGALVTSSGGTHVHGFADAPVAPPGTPRPCLANTGPSVEAMRFHRSLGERYSLLRSAPEHLACSQPWIGQAR